MPFVLLSVFLFFVYFQSSFLANPFENQILNLSQVKYLAQSVKRTCFTIHLTKRVPTQVCVLKYI